MKRFHDRYEKRVEDVIPLKNNALLVFFRNGKVKRCDIGRIKKDDRHFKPILSSEEIFQRAAIQTGGYGLAWGENAVISDSQLYEEGIDIPLSMDDFINFLSNRVISTAEAAELLECK